MKTEARFVEIIRANYQAAELLALGAWADEVERLARAQYRASGVRLAL